MNLEIVAGAFSVCKLAAGAKFPDWVHGVFTSITRTDNELSVVVSSNCVPNGVEREDGWAALRFTGSLDFSMVGVLARVSGILADAEISIFVISTFDTDYLLVKSVQLDRVCKVLGKNGYTVSGTVG